MSRSVRIGSSVDEDITDQLDIDQADLFWRHDLAAALTLLARDGVWVSLPEHGGGSQSKASVGAFQVFVTEDDLDPRPDALVA